MGNQQTRQDKQDLLPIPEMDNYWSDTDGNIFSTKRSIEPRKLTTHKHKGNGKKPYLRLKIMDKLFLQHRFIASIHIGRQLLSNEVVNHKDGNKSNNNMSNLEWVTTSENRKHAWDTKLQTNEGLVRARRKLTSEQVVEIRERYIPRCKE